MDNKYEIAKDWLPRYTGMPVDKFGDYILLTNFQDYVEEFANQFDCDIQGTNRPMSSCTNDAGLSIINFGIGSPNAATVMDLLVARKPKGVLFLGKCGGLKDSSEIGNLILPIAAIRGDGTSNDYFSPEVPALPSFKLHKFVSDKILDAGTDYRTGVIYTTNRRVWEHDKNFLKKLKKTTAIGIDMEVATIFIVGHYNEIPRGALLLVSDVPVTPDGVKTEKSDQAVTSKWAKQHLEIGIDAMTDLKNSRDKIKHFRY